MGTFLLKSFYFVHVKPSCPSGSVPPAPLSSPRAETPSAVSQLGLLPLLFPALQVVRSRGGGFGMHLGFVSWGASSPPAGFRSSERGGSASGLLSVAREHALASLAPSGAGEGWVARSQRSFFMTDTLLGWLSPFLAARSTTWGIVEAFGGSLPRFILLWFPIFGSWCSCG